MHDISFPYLPPGKTINYVPDSNPFMLAAKSEARQHSLDTAVPTGSVIVQDGQVVASGANGSSYHSTHPCRRVELGIPTGQGYDLCEGCHPKNHSEAKAVNNAVKSNIDLTNADLYLWGHWWCCIDCWTAMTKAGIKNVYLQEGSEITFNKSDPNNQLSVAQRPES